MWMDDLWADARGAVRGLRRAPMAMAVTVVSLGLGIGAVTSVFGIAGDLLLSGSVGIGAPESFVTIYTSDDEGGAHGQTSWPDFLDVRSGATVLENSAAVSVRTVVLGEGEALKPLLVEEVAGDYFGTTRMTLVLGRGIRPEESSLDAGERVAVLSHGTWTREFGASPSAIGSTVRLNGAQYTVIGVAPDGVASRRIPLQPDVWIPAGSLEVIPPGGATDRSRRTWTILGRLAAGESIESLSSQLSVLATRLGAEHAADWLDANNQPRTFTALDERASRMPPKARLLLGVLAVFFLGATGLVLLIACANVAMLNLARTASRSREMAVRLSLGASRWRLVRMFLIEGMVPGLAAGGLGLLTVAWVHRSLTSALASIPFGVPIGISFEMDARVILIALGLSLGTSLIFGLLPALEGSRPDLVPALKGDGKGLRGTGSPRLRNVMVTTQCAAAFVLLVGAALFVRSLDNAVDLDVGWDPGRIAVATKRLDAEGLDREQGLQFIRDLQSDLSQRPGVESVHASRVMEMTLMSFDPTVSVDVEGGAVIAGPGGFESPGASGGFWRNSVTPGYLAAMGMSLVAGRYLQETDSETGPRVTVVNETFAHLLWPNQNPLGRSFQAWGPAPAGADQAITEPQSFQVVGVARDGKYFDFDDPDTPYFWTSIFQDYASRIVVSVKGTESAEAMIPLLRETVQPANGEIQLTPPTTLESHYGIQVIHLRIASEVLRWAGLFGLFLSVIGIYGIVSFAVNQRMREMAIRVAIGADRGRVLGVVLAYGMRPAMLGLAVGAAIAFLGTRLLTVVLVGVHPLDPMAFVTALALLGGAALLASFVPARRSLGIDPMRVLREE